MILAINNQYIECMVVVTKSEASDDLEAHLN